MTSGEVTKRIEGIASRQTLYLPGVADITFLGGMNHETEKSNQHQTY